MISNRIPTIELHDFAPEKETFLQDVIQGLRALLKSIPCKYFYDEQGSCLFDQICDLDEYYPTRTELAIMREFGEEMAACVGSDCLLIEYGSGSGIKTRILLDHLQEPAAYVPIDISREHLTRSATDLARTYTGLQVLPVCADYTREFTLPTASRTASRRVVYFPGSTIGNFSTDEARRFLARIAGVSGVGGGLLIGVDLKKDPEILERAYNDRKGVTAAFNLNLLERINRELGADFVLDQFRHQAVYDRQTGRIEMYIVSLRDQAVHVGGQEFSFVEGDRILTECSCKYGLDEFAQLAASVGLKVERVWTDDQRLFSVQYLTVR
jgi:dimethylhistidine N-methyltransferase